MNAVYTTMRIHEPLWNSKAEPRRRNQSATSKNATRYMLLSYRDLTKLPIESATALDFITGLDDGEVGEVALAAAAIG